MEIIDTFDNDSDEIICPQGVIAEKRIIINMPDTLCERFLKIVMKQSSVYTLVISDNLISRVWLLC